MSHRHHDANILLNVNGIEVIYNHVILVLKGVSLQVPEGKVVALLGGNGAGKTTTLRAVSNLLARRARRGHQGLDRTARRAHREAQSTSDMVQRGVVQVMEGRHCFAHLTIEENLLTGAYTRKDGKAAVARDAGKGLHLLPAPEDAAQLAGGLHLGRRAADVRHRPRADGEPEDGAARRAVAWAWRRSSSRRCSRSCKDLNTQGAGDLPAGRAEHQHGAALRRLRLHPGERPHRDGRRAPRTCAKTRT